MLKYMDTLTFENVALIKLILDISDSELLQQVTKTF